MKQNGWGFDRTVSVTDIVAIISALAAGLFAYATLDKRIAVVETNQANYATQQAQQDADRQTIRMEQKDLRSEIRSDLADIKRQLERLVDRQVRNLK